MLFHLIYEQIEEVRIKFDSELGAMCCFTKEGEIDPTKESWTPINETIQVEENGNVKFMDNISKN